MAAEGYHPGGTAVYGLRRLLIPANSQRRQVMQKGEHKNLRSDHTVLTPGPKREVDCVRTIFELAADKRNSPLNIAHELNRRGLRYSENKLWDYVRVYRILKNEKYIGTNIWGRNKWALQPRPQPVPRAAWTIKLGAFPALVSAEQFASAQKQISRRRCNPGKPEKYYLDQLAKFLARKREMPPGKLKRQRANIAAMCLRHFGGLFRAYQLIGYKPSSHAINGRAAFLKMVSLRANVFNQLKALFPSVKMVHHFGEKRFRVLELDNHVRIRVHVCRNAAPSASGEARWMLRTRPVDRELPALICIPDGALNHLAAFYVVADMGPARTKWKVIRDSHPWLAPGNRLESLADLYRVATQAAGGPPPTPIEAASIVGDVVFAEDSPAVFIDGNEIHLSRPAAEIFQLLLRNAGRVVPRSILTRSRLKDKEIYLSIQISEIRKALGSRFRNRIVTVKNEGYMYEKPSHVPVDLSLGCQAY